MANRKGFTAAELPKPSPEAVAARLKHLEKQLREESLVLHLLVAAGHVDEDLVAKARDLARGIPS